MIVVSTGCSKPEPPAESTDPVIVQGKALFATMQCSNCHGDGGQGGRAPNLTAIHKSADEIAATIRTGIPDKMPQYGTKQKPEEIAAVAKYVASLQTP